MLLSTRINLGKLRVNSARDLFSIKDKHVEHIARERQKQNMIRYTNDLHKELLAKNGPTFLKCWRLKFETRSS